MLPFPSLVVHQISAQFLFANPPAVYEMSSEHPVQMKNLIFPPDLPEFPERKVACGGLAANNLKREIYVLLYYFFFFFFFLSEGCTVFEICIWINVYFYFISLGLILHVVVTCLRQRELLRDLLSCTKNTKLLNLKIL